MGWLAKGSAGTGGTSEVVRSRCERATDRREADDFARGIVGNGATRRCGYCSSRIDRADADEVDGVGLLGRGGVGYCGRMVELEVAVRKDDFPSSRLTAGWDSNEGKTPSRS